MNFRLSLFFLTSLLAIPAWSFRCESVFTSTSERIFKSIKVNQNPEENKYAIQLLNSSPSLYIKNRWLETLGLFKNPKQFELGLIRLYVELELLVKERGLSLKSEIQTIKEYIFKLQLLNLNKSPLPEKDLVLRAAKYYETVLRIKQKISNLNSLENGALTFFSQRLSTFEDQPFSKQALVEVFLSAIENKSLKSKIKKNHEVENGRWLNIDGLYRDILSGELNDALFAIQVGQLLNQVIQPQRGDVLDKIMVFKDKSMENLLNPKSNFSGMKISSQLGIKEVEGTVEVELHTRNTQSMTNYLKSALRKIQTLDTQGSLKKVRLVIMTESLQEVSMIDVRALTLHGLKNINLEVVFLSFENYNAQIKELSEEMHQKTKNVSAKYIYIPKETIDNFHNSDMALSHLKEVAKISQGHRLADTEVQSLIMIMGSF